VVGCATLSTATTSDCHRALTILIQARLLVAFLMALFALAVTCITNIFAHMRFPQHAQPLPDMLHNFFPEWLAVRWQTYLCLLCSCFDVSVGCFACVSSLSRVPFRRRLVVFVIVFIDRMLPSQAFPCASRLVREGM